MVSAGDDEDGKKATDHDMPREIIFSVDIKGSYDQIRDTLTNLERSVRPFDVRELNIQGSGNDLSATISIATYYLPAKVVELKKETIKP